MTRSRVSGATPGRSFNTLDAVATDTAASKATASSVARGNSGATGDFGGMPLTLGLPEPDREHRTENFRMFPKNLTTSDHELNVAETQPDRQILPLGNPPRSGPVAVSVAQQPRRMSADPGEQPTPRRTMMFERFSGARRRDGVIATMAAVTAVVFALSGCSGSGGGDTSDSA